MSAAARILRLTERFRLRVIGLLEEKGLHQKDLRGSKTEGWVSNIITGRRGIKLDDVEGIAEALNVPVAELVRRGDDRVYDLSGTEARLIDAFRQLSFNEQTSLLTLATLRLRGSTVQSGSDRLPKLASARGADHGPNALPPAVVAYLAEAERKISSWYEADARRQVASPRRKVAGASKSRRDIGGPDSETD